MPTFSVGQRVGDRFQIKGLLGAGSSGAVYDVRDERIGRRAALKVLWDQADEGSDAWLRLKREVIAAQAIRDPRVIAVHDLLIVEGRPALLMERVEGTSLREKILLDGAFEPTEAIRVIADVLGALGLLHKAGIVHRDVKSGNILLAESGEVKLGDFGLVKGEDVGATLTATGTTLGTPSTMAPEVIRGEKATPASDLYSAGIVLFEMLAGRLPFEGTSGLHVAHQHLSVAPPMHVLKEKRVPRWLAAVVARLLEKDPLDRYSSADEVLVALRDHRAESWPHRLARAVRRYRWQVLGGAFLAAACVGATVWWAHAGRPLALSFRDRILEARSPSGALLWSQTLPRAVQSVCFGSFGPGGSEAAACAVACDDQDHGVETREESASAVWIFDRRGKFIERVSLEPMGKGFAPRYFVNLSAHRFASNEPERLVVYARHVTWHPTVLSVFSLDKRRPWEQRRMPDLSFLNSGSIPGWIYQDLDGDGRDDILCAGVNMSLFWADFVAGLKVGPPGGEPIRVTSPDRDMGLGMRPLSYRFFSFEPYLQLRVWRDAGGRGLVAFGDRPPWTVGPEGGLLKAGWRVPPAAAAESFNALLPKLISLRESGRWEDLLSESEKLPEGVSDSYDWVRRLYRADALMALGRGAEAETLVRPNGPGETPPYAYQIAMDTRFLEGQYGRCMDMYASLPEALRRNKPELGNTLLLSALYTDDGKALAERAASDQVFNYTWYPSMLLAAQRCLEGNPGLGEEILRAMGPEVNEEAGPRLWLVECLLRQGKMADAERALSEAERWREESPAELEEAEAWLRWCAGDRDAALVQRFAPLVEQARLNARSSPLVRAFLPLTLAREAAMIRASGARAQADRLLAESLRLSPRSWHKVLTERPRAMAAGKPGSRP